MLRGVNLSRFLLCYFRNRFNSVMVRQQDKDRRLILLDPAFSWMSLLNTMWRWPSALDWPAGLWLSLFIVRHPTRLLI
jgi:hypothetical protein